MKTHLFLAFAITSLSLTSAFSQAPAQPPMISVTGSVEVKVAPDEIFLRVGVETRHENLEDAKKQNDERISKALGGDLRQRTGRFRLAKSAYRLRLTCRS